MDERADARRPVVYLAGPDVFLRDARSVGEAKRTRCAAAGLDARFPLDEMPEVADASGSGAARAGVIRRTCLVMMDGCDAALANLTPFRGVSADAGTTFEVGYLTARGVPVVGYTSAVEDYATRVREAGPPDGMVVEDFGLADNLMLGAGIPVFAVAGGGLAADEAFGAALVHLVERLRDGAR